MVRQIPLFSVLATSVLGDHEHHALMQARIGAEGVAELAYDTSEGRSAAEMQLMEDLGELAHMKVDHDMQEDQFRLSLQHRDGVSMFELEETHIFGAGVKLYGANGSMSVHKPSFRTFKTTDGRLARVQLNNDGNMVGWVLHEGQLVQFRKHVKDSSAAIAYLKHKLKEQLDSVDTELVQQGPAPNSKRKDKQWLDEHKDMEQGHGAWDTDHPNRQVWYAVDRGHEEGHAHGDGLENDMTDDGATWSADPASPEAGGSGTKKGRGRGKKKGRGGGKKKGRSLLETSWSGNSWVGSCYPDDADTHVMQVGLVIDMKAQAGDDWNSRHGYSYNGGTWDSEAAYQVNTANQIYHNQMNIELKLGDGFPFAYASDADAPDFLKSSCAVYTATNSNSGLLNKLGSWISGGMDGKANKDDVVSTHLLTGCNPSGYGSVGLAWVGTLCNGAYASGVDHMNSGWATYAHELGHNFGGGHSFEDGQGKTGGIMDYGDGKLNGIYQFNTKYRKTEVCNELTEAKTKCSSTAFYKATTGASPRRRTPAPTPAPTTPRRRSPPRRRSGGGGGGDCVDKSPTNIKLNGADAPCSQLSNFCAGYAFVRTACPVTCQEECTTRPSPEPTPAPTPPPTPAPTPMSCTTADKQSKSNCDHWKRAGFCAPGNNYYIYMQDNCCTTCGAEAAAPTPSPSGSCVGAGTVPNDCSACRESSQCQSGGFCCPFMKKCVTSSSQSCSYPIASCQPICHDADCDSCSPSDGTAYSDWGSPSCR